MIEFKKWPSIPRLENETYTVTEKIDGSNGCIIITETGEIGCQSRKNIITPDRDNFGFAQWVEDNKKDLLKLGPGYHYGEWWGHKIQRGYGLEERRFSLFAWWTPSENMPECCHKVPLISKDMLYEELQIFRLKESKAAPGYERTEGVVAKSNISNKLYKLIWDK